jgi:hypothetical protein
VLNESRRPMDNICFIIVVSGNKPETTGPTIIQLAGGGLDAGGFYVGFFFFWFDFFFFCLGNLSFEERPGEQSAFRQLRWAHCGRRFQLGRPRAASLKRWFERGVFERCIRVAAADKDCVNVNAIRRRRRSVASPIGYRSIDVPHQAVASTAVPSSGSRIGPIRLAAAIQWIGRRRL